MISMIKKIIAWQI